MLSFSRVHCIFTYICKQTTLIQSFNENYDNEIKIKSNLLVISFSICHINLFIHLIFYTVL